MRGKPPRTALACGALGSYRREIVAEVAGRLGVPMREVHRDRDSILFLDRRPLRWGRPWRRHGLAWSELSDPGRLPRPRSWGEAATRLRACGLVIDGERRVIHSSVTGIAPVYYLERDGAVYFASRIDPLVGALGGPLSIDWDAWASILALGHPVGARTPFTEVRRLGPYERLSRSRHGARVRHGDWPWQQAESRLSVSEGVGPMLDALRASIAPLAARRGTSLLSGGLDSRLLLALLAEAGADDVVAITLGADEGMEVQREVAAKVASRYGVGHEVHDYRDPGHYLDVWAEHSLRVDFQRPRTPWLSVLGEPAGARGGIVWDGLALDMLATHASPEAPWFYDREMLAAPDDSAGTARRLWDRTLRRSMRRGHARVLRSDVARRLVRISRRSFVGESRRLRGHRSQAPLLLYRTRTVRGVASMPTQVLGAHATVATPFADHDVAVACTAIDPLDKYDFHLYRELFAAVDPGAWEIESSVSLSGPQAPPRRRMRLSEPALRRFERQLQVDPLPRLHSEALGRHLDEGTLGEAFRASRSLYRGVLALAMLGEWLERYDGALRAVELPGGTEAGVASG
ncbi:MAG TPA: asparagine synthase-related protein [Solirubrobacterales bacterium]|nr:asparagine synthase-related protein [Solirubrobacterales bacterium]